MRACKLGYLLCIELKFAGIILGVSANRFKGLTGTREFKRFFDHLPPGEPIKKELLDAIKILQENYLQGNKITHDLWPQKYVKKYGITNLWRLRLDSGWRLMYTIFDEKDGFVICIFEALPHGKYEKRFDY